MGYALAVSACYLCHSTFGYNPHKVPSLVVNGLREPVCRPCAERGNELRAARGLPGWKIEDGAYEAIDEADL